MWCSVCFVVAVVLVRPGVCILPSDHPLRMHFARSTDLLKPIENTPCYETPLFVDSEARIEKCENCFRNRASEEKSDEADKCIPQVLTTNELFAAKCSVVGANFQQCWTCLKNANQIPLESKEGDEAKALWKECVAPSIQESLHFTCQKWDIPQRLQPVGLDGHGPVRFLGKPLYDYRDESDCIKCVEKNMPLFNSVQSSETVERIRSDCTKHFMPRFMTRCSRYFLNSTRTACAVCVRKFMSSVVIAQKSEMPCFRFPDPFQAVFEHCKNALSRNVINSTVYNSCTSCLVTHSKTIEAKFENFPLLHDLCHPVNFYAYNRFAFQNLAQKYKRSAASIEECFFKHRGEVMGTIQQLKAFQAKCLGDLRSRRDAVGTFYCEVARDKKSCEECVKKISIDESDTTQDKLEAAISVCAGADQPGLKSKPMHSLVPRAFPSARELETSSESQGESKL